MKDNDLAVNIRRGQLTLSGQVPLCDLTVSITRRLTLDSFTIGRRWHPSSDPRSTQLFVPSKVNVMGQMRRHFPWVATTIAIQFDRSCLLSKTVFLVGGFAASPWLYSSLKNELQSSGIALYRPDSHTYVFTTCSGHRRRTSYGLDIAGTRRLPMAPYLSIWIISSLRVL